MHAAVALVETPNPDRHLVRLVTHASRLQATGPLSADRRSSGEHPAVLAVDYSAAESTLTMSTGRCVLRVAPGLLTVYAKAATLDGLRQIQQAIGRDQERLGHREAPTVRWQHPTSPRANSLPAEQ